MAGTIVEKLYPPTIGSSIPAFYNDDGTVIITVPFSMNRAVSSTDFDHFALKIKTALSNTYLTTLYTNSSEKSSLVSSRIVTFTWANPDGDTAFLKISIGLYLKVLLAYVDSNDNTGYFSTVATVKYTAKPSVYIENAVMTTDINTIPVFRESYVGVYEPSDKDRAERPYSYNFFLYDSNLELIETSGWLLHNTSINNVASESLSLTKTSDTYTYKSSLKIDKEYYIQYGVKTINNLEIYTPMYPCIDAAPVDSDFYISLNTENVFEEGYILIGLKVKDGYTIVSSEMTDLLLANSLARDGITPTITASNGIRIATLNGEVIGRFVNTELTDNVSIEVSRAEIGYLEEGTIIDDSLYDWKVLRKAYFTSYEEALEWSFRDFTVEQGVTYAYCFRLYNASGVLSNREVSTAVLADFEDMFLWDGERQLKVRFNPKVTSFKRTILEQKLDTIGSKYPFVFRNGTVDYKEFPIGGLISYLTDNNLLFLKHEEDLDIILGKNSEREGTPTLKHDWMISETLDSVGYNMRAERRFKMKLLEWLSDGEIKLFRSPAEGNFLVRLMNISLSPEDRLGRMLHTFTATAYEVEELNYKNLLELGFINIDEEEEEKIFTETINIYNDKISSASLSASIKLNNHSIINLLRVDGNSSNGSFYLRIGKDDTDSKVLITPNSFKIEGANVLFPDVYYNPYDNLEFTSLSRSQIQTYLGDSTLTYSYSTSEIKAGELLNIDSVYVKNIIETVSGPIVINTAPKTNNDGSREELIKFLVLDFKLKETIDVIYNDGSYYYKDYPTIELDEFESIYLYDVYLSGSETATTYYAAAGSLVAISEEPNRTVTLTYENNQQATFLGTPTVNPNYSTYTAIELGNGIYLNYACSKRYITFKNT